MADAASLPHLERIGPDYVASVIAAFRTLVRGRALAGPDSEYERTRLAAAAVLPLTEMLAARGPLDALPLADWMLAAGEAQARTHS